jgi:urease accessory protein
MIIVRSVRPAGSWSGAPADSVVLDHDDRYRRRVAMTSVRGLAFLLDLPEAVMLRAGDGLALDDGRIVEVVASPEPLAEIRCKDAVALARVAWHLGNRHLPVEVTRRALRIRRDHVIEDMARGLGAEILAIEAPFNPEGGAYAASAHDHDAHDHARHDHDHSDHSHRDRDHDGGSRAHRDHHHHDDHAQEHGVSNDHRHDRPKD